MLLAALVVGVAAVGCSGGDSRGHAASPDPIRVTDLGLPDLTNRVIDVTSPRVPESPAAPAATPEAAVAQFAAAEQAGDTSTSFGLLSQPDRTTIVTRAAWLNQHGRLPKLTSFTGAKRVAGATAASVDIRGDATFEPRLDEVSGLVPKNATITWHTVAEDGGWRISYAGTRFDAIYPAETGATDAVLDWVRAYTQCRTPDPASQYGGGLVGVPALAGRLCGMGPNVFARGPVPLGDKPDPTPVIAAFGPEADRWARIVHVTKPIDLDVVTAPLGDRWIVVGLLDSKR
jgi:hypothetical protein